MSSASQPRTTRTIVPLAAAVLLLQVALAGCVSTGDPSQAVVVARDLSKVAGCQFRGTVRAPRGQSGLPRSPDNDGYVSEVKRRTYALGGNHLYLMNEAAGWGGAEALGAAYHCTS